MIHRNGRTLLRKWRMFSWNSTHSPHTQTEYPSYPLGTMWKLCCCRIKRPWICDRRILRSSWSNARCVAPIYLHNWTIKGAHARFVTYAEHAGKCKDATISKGSSTTFYRWKQKEEENFAKSPDKDEQLPQEAHPIRHESQVHGLLRTIKEDREFAKSTNPKEQPLMKHVRPGRQYNFDPLWYPQLISMTEESLDSMVFDPETIAVCATQIFSEKLWLPAEESSFNTSSDTWCYWFMRQQMGWSLRKLCTSPLSPEARIKQDQLHEITLQRIALLLDEGFKSKYVIGSDEFGMLLFPQGQYRWSKIGSKEVKGTVKEDRRQYTDDITRSVCRCTTTMLSWDRTWHVCMTDLWIRHRSSGMLWRNCPMVVWSWCLSLLVQQTGIRSMILTCTSRWKTMYGNWRACGTQVGWRPWTRCTATRHRVFQLKIIRVECQNLCLSWTSGTKPQSGCG